MFKLFILIIIFLFEFLNGTKIPSEFKQLLEDITPNFQENLNRAFKNEGVRFHNRKNTYIHPLDNTLFSLGETKIELSNLKFPWVPDFRVNHIIPNLSMMCVDVNFKLGSLRVEGEYEANNFTLQKFLPVSNNGKIIITFQDVTAEGRVGLLIKEDSLVPTNYDIKYKQKETDIRVSYFTNDETEIENKITKSNGEASLGDTVWDQITDILTNLLHRQLGEVVVEFSLTELLIDRPDELREIARERSFRANNLLDSLLCKAKDFLVGQNYRTVKTPPFDVVYRGKPSSLQQGALATGTGYVQDLATLTRLQDLSLYEDERTLVAYGSIALRDFKHGYENFTSSFEETTINGSIKTSIYRNQIFIKLSVVKDGEQCNTRLDTVQFSTVKDIDVDASGLGSLSWLAPKLRAWVIANLRYQALPVVEKYIKEAFLHAIANTDCRILVAE